MDAETRKTLEALCQLNDINRIEAAAIRAALAEVDALTARIGTLAAIIHDMPKPDRSYFDGPTTEQSAIAARDEALRLRAQVADLTTERDEAKRACRNAHENFTNIHRTTSCVSCQGRGGTLDAGGNVTEVCEACGGTGGEVDRLTRRLAIAEKWKARAEDVGLQTMKRAMKAESDLAAALSAAKEAP